MVDSCGHSNKPSAATNDGEFLEQLSNFSRRTLLQELSLLMDKY
jgi:hypothetical protein